TDARRRFLNLILRPETVPPSSSVLAITADLVKNEVCRLNAVNPFRCFCNRIRLQFSGLGINRNDTLAFFSLKTDRRLIRGQYPVGNAFRRNFKTMVIQPLGSITVVFDMPLDI